MATESVSSAQKMEGLSTVAADLLRTSYSSALNYANLVMQLHGKQLLTDEELFAALNLFKPVTTSN